MIKEFYYIENKTSICPGLTSAFFDHGPLPIIWHNQGLYGLIPAALIANALILHRITNIAFAFSWDQVIHVPQVIGEQLFNEQLDNQTDSNKS